MTFNTRSVWELIQAREAELVEEIASRQEAYGRVWAEALKLARSLEEESPPND